MSEGIGDFFNWVIAGLGAIGSAFGWLWKEMLSMKKETKRVDTASMQRDDEMENHIFDVKLNYLPRAEHDKTVARIEGKLDKILDKLDSKVDK
jgi:hypothetical protein